MLMGKLDQLQDKRSYMGIIYNVFDPFRLKKFLEGIKWAQEFTD
jgi:hypothetical protein